ncbi:MAG: PAS domain S-box protein, partial [Anaerolineales bacterium]|nr:PAS domain S-box protein [Anaerolineales bacterium]
MISFFRVPQHRSRFLFRILLFSLTLTTACANTAETNASFNHTWVYWLIGIGTGLLLITVGYGIALFNYNQQLQTAVTKRTLSLQESEEKLSALLENSHASIWAIDKQYRYILGNKTFQTGLNSDLGWDIATGESVLFDHLPPAEKAEWQAYYDKALEGKSFQVERKNSYPSQPQWSEYYFGPIKDKTGQIAGVTIVALDITKRKEKEELLNKFHQIIAVTPDSISLVDTNYVYQIVNPAYMQRTTKSYDDIVGHSVSEVMGADVFEKLIKPEFDACLRGKTIHYQEWFTYVGEGRRFMDVTYAPYQSKTGGIDGVLVSARDLTSTRQAEDHLQQEMARFQTVWQISQDAMALSDENGVVIDANPAYSVLYGYDLDEIINHNFAVICPEKSREWANEAYRKTFTNPEIPPVFESVVQRRDGTIRQVESRIRFIEENGGRTAMLSTIRDITEQKQAA